MKQKWVWVTLFRKEVERYMIKSYIKKRIIPMGILLGMLFFQVLCYSMYGLPFDAIIYPAFLCVFAGIIIVVIDYFMFVKKRRHLELLVSLPENLLGELSVYSGAYDDDYKRIIEAFDECTRSMTAKTDGKYSELLDYYTLWVHQIKTPIASMRLSLQNEDSVLSRKISKDLTDIEQYVDMVLCYLRLDSDSTDYVFHEYDIDEVIRQAVRKLAGQFIGKGLSLKYEPIEKHVLTDDKWLSFVIGQVMSNALKYTNEGYVKLYAEEEENELILCISDTGIGIAPEDIPRIFDKGYTGFNGRSDKKASGLGLYLCKRICNNLGVDLKAESEIGKGTTVKIVFPTEKRIHE